MLRHWPSRQAVTSNGNSKERLFVDRFGSRRACLSRRRNDADERICRVQESDLVPGRALLSQIPITGPVCLTSVASTNGS